MLLIDILLLWGCCERYFFLWFLSPSICHLYIRRLLISVHWFCIPPFWWKHLSSVGDSLYNFVGTHITQSCIKDTLNSCFVYYLLDHIHCLTALAKTSIIIWKDMERVDSLALDFNGNALSLFPFSLMFAVYSL